MTAVNCFIHTNCVHVLTDGACYDVHGTLQSHITKQWTLPHLNMCVAGRGPASIFPLAAEFIGTIATTFDDAKTLIVDRLREFSEAVSPWMCSSFGTDLELLIAGVGSAGPEAFWVCNHERHGPAMPPWTILPVREMSAGPWEPAMVAEFRARHPNISAGWQIDPESHGLDILEIQRKHDVAHSDDGSKNFRSVGGHALLTTVSTNGIQQRVIHRWPDEIGQPIGAAKCPQAA